MTERERRKAAKAFSKLWADRGNEKQVTQEFWTTLLRDVFEVEKPEEIIEFEHTVEFEKSTKYIDGLIPSKGILIEQKGKDFDLNVKELQSDGKKLTPFEQALRYEKNLGYGKDFDIKIRYIITCNFQTFQIYDLSNSIRQKVPIATIELDNFENNFHQLDILVDKKADPSKELEISKNAGEIIGKIYNAFLDMLGEDITKEETRILNIFCVRLVFCYFAEDAGLFEKNSFKQYLKRFQYDDWKEELEALFVMLDKKERTKFDSDKLRIFPYVNGSLFTEKLPVPPITEDIATLIINGCNFDWREINPTIFGAVFESTLNPETRRAGGMHYTSRDNIHKVIDPLFLDEFLDEFDSIMEVTEISARNRKLRALQEKMASKKFFDPACGSGNFLTETYVSLRRLENRILKELRSEQVAMFATGKEQDDVKVSIQQFYGIEINDFAVSVAKTALWIAEIQMLEETAEIFLSTQQALPLRTYNNIIEGNALQIDWETVVPKNELSYIMGNPPFLGARLMSKEQKEDIALIFGKLKGAGNLDYVSCWYKKATDLMQGTNIKSALVSTNSITQGEQPAILFKPLYEQGIHFDFAYRTFVWDSEASDKAHVHCVIIGFSCSKSKEKKIFDNENIIVAENINAYLLNAPSVFVNSVSKPICKVSKMDFGSMPNDKGYLSNYSTEEKNNIIAKYPEAEKLFKRLVGAEEFINGKDRWCLWLKDVDPMEYINIPPVWEAVEEVRKIRESSTREATKKLAETPMLFGEIRQPDTEYLLVPRVSSENRKYVPVGFMNADEITADSCLLIPNASLYEFGILTSNVHMAWMRAVAGRLKSDYRYSAKIVYNNFPWCNPTSEQKAKIEQTAQAILEARKNHPNATLADMYGSKMNAFVDLYKAHMANDRAVMEAYCFPVKSSFTEADCVAELMKIYQNLTND